MLRSARSYISGVCQQYTVFVAQSFQWTLMPHEKSATVEKRRSLFCTNVGSEGRDGLAPKQENNRFGVVQIRTTKPGTCWDGGGYFGKHYGCSLNSMLSKGVHASHIINNTWWVKTTWGTALHQQVTCSAVGSLGQRNERATHALAQNCE